MHRAATCEPVVSLVRSSEQESPPVPLIVLPKSCSCRWGGVRGRIEDPSHTKIVHPRPCDLCAGFFVCKKKLEHSFLTSRLCSVPGARPSRPLGRWRLQSLERVVESVGGALRLGACGLRPRSLSSTHTGPVSVCLSCVSTCLPFPSRYLSPGDIWLEAVWPPRVHAAAPAFF